MVVQQNSTDWFLAIHRQDYVLYTHSPTVGVHISLRIPIQINRLRRSSINKKTIYQSTNSIGKSSKTLEPCN